MNRFIVLALFLGYCTAGQSNQSSADAEIERQWHSDELNAVALKTQYTSDCMNSAFKVDQTLRATLCNLVADDLLASTVQRSLSLKQYINTTACSAGQNSWDDDCFEASELLHNNLRDAIIVSLCEMDATFVQADEHSGYIKRGSKVYDSTTVLYDCDRGWFADDLSYGGFTIHPNEIEYYEFPELLDRLDNSIQSDNEADFSKQLDRLSEAQLLALGQPLLLRALDQSNLYYVEKLLSLGVSPNTPNDFFNQPLAKALSLGRNEAAALLMNKGANPAVFDESGNSGLYLAVENCSTDVVNLLLDRNVDVDGQLENLAHASASPLAKAAEFGREEVFVRLLAEGASTNLSPNGHDGQNRTLLEMAARGGNDVIFDLLVAKGVKPRNKWHHLTLKSAIRGGSAHILKTLLSMGVEIPADKHGEILFAFLNESPSRKNTAHPYHQPSQYQRPEQLDMLVKQGLNIEFRENGAFEYIDRFTSIYSDPSDHTDPVANSFLKERQALTLSAIRHYADAGLDLDHIDDETLLMDAAEGGYLEVVELLLELGADKNIATKSGKTAQSVVAYQLSKKIKDYPKRQDNRENIEKIYFLLDGKIEDLPDIPDRSPITLESLFRKY